MSQTPLFTRETSLPTAWRYSVIRKFSAALTGLVMVAFLLGHWIGNSVLLEGEAAFTEYYAWLMSQTLLHYAVYTVIITAFLIHLAVGPQHWLENRRARPIAYKKKQNQATTLAARTMMVSGTLLFLFLVFHIAQMRGLINFSDYDSLYQNIQAGFSLWWVVAIYLLGQLALGFHLYHGLWSQFQTLGIFHPRYNHLRRPFAVLIGLGIASLNIALVMLNTEMGQQLLEKIS